MAKGDDNGKVTELAAWRKWRAIPEGAREAILANVFCPTCKVTRMAPGFTVRQDRLGFVLEGTCSKCGRPVARFVEEV